MRAFLALVVAAVVAAAVTIAASPQAKSKAPASQPAPSNKSAPPATGPDQTSAPSSITGTVLETMDSGGYTYMKLKTQAGDMWTAVNQAKVKKGQTVTIATPMMMENFESKTLKRKFDRIVFGTLAAGAAAGSASGLPPGHPSTGGAAADPSASPSNIHASAAQGPAEAPVAKVAKAEGASGRTIAELYAQKATLAGKEVALRGKVVKYTPEVMGKNWLHLRDGSGSRAGKNDDITVTTTAAAQIGDVVLVRGTVKTNRDFGAGYTYPVIIEDAKVTK